MQFDSFADIIAMGGYGFYVWLVFFVFVVLMSGLVVQTRMARRRLILESKRNRARHQRMAAARNVEGTL